MSRTLETIIVVNGPEWRGDGASKKYEFIAQLNDWLKSTEHIGEFTSADLGLPVAGMFFSDLIVGAVKSLDIRELIGKLQAYDWDNSSTGLVQLFYRGDDSSIFRILDIYASEEEMQELNDDIDDDELKIAHQYYGN